MMRSSPMMQRSLGRTNHLHQILPNSLMWIPAHQTNHQSHQWLWRMARIWEWGSTASHLQKMCKQEEDSANWKQRYLVKFPRKGDFFLNVATGKGSCSFLIGDILERLEQILGRRLRSKQAGFHQDQQCPSHIIIASIITEQFVKWQSLVDIEMAFV